MSEQVDRRAWLKSATLLGVLGAIDARASEAGPAMDDPKARPFRYCLNTSTIRGQNLPADEQARIAATAGYDGIEPWVGDLDAYVTSGGSLPDLGKRIADLGLTVESAIGFPKWIVDDPTERANGLDEARRCMRNVRAIGGTRVAAPPAGATDEAGLDLDRAAERFAKLVEVGREEGVLPQLEVWGFSKNLFKLPQAVYVAVASGAADALILADVYHLYRGGSAVEGLALLNGQAMKVFHINDYPDLSRESITDADRVFPGWGVAKVDRVLKILFETGFRGAVSLELFNREYWKQEPLEVARLGLEGMKRCVEAAGLPA